MRKLKGVACHWHEFLHECRPNWKSLKLISLFGHPQVLELMRSFSGRTASGGDSYSHTLTTTEPLCFRRSLRRDFSNWGEEDDRHQPWSYVCLRAESKAFGRLCERSYLSMPHAHSCLAQSLFYLHPGPSFHARSLYATWSSLARAVGGFWSHIHLAFLGGARLVCKSAWAGTSVYLSGGSC